MNKKVYRYLFVLKMAVLMRHSINDIINIIEVVDY